MGVNYELRKFIPTPGQSASDGQPVERGRPVGGDENRADGRWVRRGAAEFFNRARQARADGEGAALRGRCRVVPAVGGFPLAVGGLTQRRTISWLYSSQENSKIT